MLMRFEPFRELDRITQEVLSERRARSIPLDAYRRRNELTIQLDLPGVDPRFIEVTVEKDVLTVRATRPGSRPRTIRSK
jgi:HSP20 family protein